MALSSLGALVVRSPDDDDDDDLAAFFLSFFFLASFFLFFPALALGFAFAFDFGLTALALRFPVTFFPVSSSLSYVEKFKCRRGQEKLAGRGIWDSVPRKISYHLLLIVVTSIIVVIIVIASVLMQTLANNERAVRR